MVCTLCSSMIYMYRKYVHPDATSCMYLESVTLPTNAAQNGNIHTLDQEFAQMTRKRNDGSHNIGDAHSPS